MPQVSVPRYQSKIRPQTAPDARLDPRTPDAAFGNGLSKIADAATEIIEKERKKADEIAVLDADRKLGEFENNALYSKEGALTKRGKDAFDVPERVMADFDKTAGEIYAGLGNDNQRLAFRRYQESRRRDIDRTVQRHVAQEIKAYDDQTTESLVANEHEAAVFNYRDPERIGHSIARIQDELTRYANRNALPQEWTKQKVETATSKVHASVVQRMLSNGEDQLAKGYYTANKDSMRGTDLSTVEKALEEGTVRGESQRQTDSILAQHGSEDDRTKALEAARGIKDPKIRDLVEERVNKYFTERSAANTERLNKFVIGAANVIDKTGDENKIDPNVWSQLSLEARSALKTYAKHKREGTEPELDHPTWVKFTYQSTEQLAKMSEADFMTNYYPKLDKAHRDRGLEIMRLARESYKKEGEKDPKFATTVTFKDQVQNTLNLAGITKPGKSPKDWDAETSRRAVAFEDEAWKRVQQYELSELQGKRPATRLEMQSIMDKVLIDKVFVDEWGRDPEVPAVFIKPDQRGKVYVPLAQVPKDIKMEAVNIAKSLGNIPQNMNQAEAEKILARRIERAYGARLTRASRQEIIDIIRGAN